MLKILQVWLQQYVNLLTMPKPLTVWTTTNCGKFFKRRVYHQLTCLLRNLYTGQEATARTRHGTTDWSKLGKEYVKGVYFHPAYLTYVQSTSCKMPGWMKYKLESRLPGEISITSDMQNTSSYGRKQRRTEEPLDESERGE